jgi:hypothetical protein
MNAAQRCSDASEHAHEPLGATATNAENWLLVEVPGTWSRDVSDGAGLPEPTREAVRAWLERTPSSRLLYIRRPGRLRRSGQVAFVVHAGETTTAVRRIEVASAEELAGVDLSHAGEPRDAQLVLVCGHGSRDQCCSLRGTAVYAALASRLEADEVWISSHQGGHRFAANVLVLPAGVQLGRVTPDEAPYVVARALAGRVVLDRYRGRNVYPQRVQAAERVIREAEGIDTIADLRFAGTSGDHVRFLARDGRDHAAVVEEVVGAVVPASCGADPEPQAAFTARLA